MPPGGRKRKGSKKKNKKGEGQDSNNQDLHSNNNNYSTHPHGSVDDPKNLEERDSDGGEFEREEEEEEVVDQREVDVAKGDGLEEEVVQVAVEEKSMENGSGGADFGAVNVEQEDQIVAPASEEDSVAGNFDAEDKEVAVVEEEVKSVIAEFGELKEENASGSSALDGEAVADCVEDEAVVEFNEPVRAQMIFDEEEEDLVKEVVELASEEVVSAGAESLGMPVPPDVVDLELTKNVDSSFSQISDDKDEFSSAIEADKSEQIENPVKAVSVDDEDKSSDAPPVSNGVVVDDVKPLETDNFGAAVAINTSRGVDNGKEFEIQKPSEDQPLIGSNPLPVRRTSWTGCCGLFEVFSGASR